MKKINKCNKATYKCNKARYNDKICAMKPNITFKLDY